MTITLLDMLNNAASSQKLTKKRLGEIVADPNSTPEEVAEAIREMNEAGGYECLGD